MRYQSILRMFFIATAISVAQSAAHADEQAKITWDFSADAKGWQVWGTPKDASPDMEKEMYRWVSFDAAEGHTGKGALKITDPSPTAGPYALGPAIPVSAMCGYTLSGWVKTEKDSLPDIFVMFSGESGELKSVFGSSDSKPCTSIEKPDDKGWRKFQLTIPASSVPGRAKARIAIRPAPNYASRDAFVGTVWVDDVTWEQTTGDPRSAAISADPKDNWVEFVPGVQATKPGAVSLSFLMDAPAGKHGYLQVKDGNFVFADGTPARFWGTNIHAAQGLFPTHEQAEAVASAVTRYGCNIVRIHLAETMLIDKTRPDRQTFISDDKWEPFDYLVKCLKDRGVYVLLDSITGLSSRDFQEADGIKEPKIYYQHKTWVYYEPRFQELGRSYMKGLLSHVNRYTGNTLATEPAIAMMLLINEQSAFFEWNINAQPPYYKELLQRRFNQWLMSKYGSREALETAWRLSDGASALRAEEDPTRGTVSLPASFFGSWGENLAPAVTAKAGSADHIRYRAMIDFLKDLQLAFSKGMVAQAHELGVKVPVVTTNIICDLADLQTMADAGVTSQNSYWDHVQKVSGMYFMKNVPEVTVNPLRRAWGCESQIVGIKVAGCATISTENDAMWPHEWRSGHLMLTAATAAHQDLDAIFQYGYGGGWGYTWTQMQATNGIPQPCMEFNDPAMLSSLVAGSLLYLRRDVATSPALVRLQVNDELAYAAQAGLRNGSFPTNYLPFVCRFEHLFSGSQPAATAQLVLKERGTGTADDGEKRARELDAELKKSGIIPQGTGLVGQQLISDTREIVRDWGKGLFTVNTPRSQGFTGFPSAESIVLKDVSFQCKTPFATIQASSLNDRPLAQADRILLIAVARADNKASQMTFVKTEATPQGKRGLDMTQHDPGTGPVVVEPVRATIKLKGSRIRITPLGPDLVPQSDRAREMTADADGNILVNIGQENVSIWYLIERM